MALLAIERAIAWRYLRARRRDGFLSVITWFSIVGITLGVATLILVTSLMNGIRHEMMSQFIGVDGHITVYGQTRAITDYENLAEKIKTVEDVRSVIPRVEGQVMAMQRGVSRGAQVVGIEAADIRSKTAISEHISEQALSDFSETGGVLLGDILARNLGVRAGGSVTLIAPEGRATFAGLVPRMKAYPVAGTFRLGMNQLDASLVLMPLNEAQVYFTLTSGEQGAVNALEVTGRDIESASQLAQAIQEELGEGYRVYDWQRSNATVFNALLVQRNVMVIILALIVLVAAFNIIASLIMLVREKSRDVAVLRTMGATRPMIMRIFIANGGFIGLVGTTLGVALGLLLARYIEQVKQGIESLMGQEILLENIYFLSTLPTRTDWREVVVVVAASLLISLLATLYPAWRAARLDPVEVLRYE